MEEHQKMLAHEKEARDFLRENDPSSAGLREAQVAAAQAKTAALVAALPGTPEEIQERLLKRGAELEGPAAPGNGSQN